MRAAESHNHYRLLIDSARPARRSNCIIELTRQFYLSSIYVKLIEICTAIEIFNEECDLFSWQVYKLQTELIFLFYMWLIFLLRRRIAGARLGFQIADRLLVYENKALAFARKKVHIAVINVEPKCVEMNAALGEVAVKKRVRGDVTKLLERVDLTENTRYANSYVKCVCISQTSAGLQY